MALHGLKEISDSTGYSRRTLNRWTKLLFPERCVTGIKTLLTDEETEKLLDALKRYSEIPSGQAKLIHNFVNEYRKEYLS